MGPEERIIAEEDRLFLTSLGNWTGDAYRWRQAEWVPYWSARFDFTPANPSAKETLAYPAVLIEPNGTGYFQIFFSTWIPPDALTLTLTVTDGNYLFVGTYTAYPITWGWPTQFGFDTPVDWNKENAYVEIGVEVVSSADSAVYFFYPSVIQSWTPIVPPHKVQYLPIMGIG